jgi:16S rRNA (adenine(1408)-N(1))-methyltransferase
MKVMHGKDIINIDSATLRERIAGYAGVVLDIGTGDGKYVYQCARAQPQQFYIGLDASPANLGEHAVKTRKKPARGGMPNVLYVIANAEQMPPELSGIASQLHIHFPWGNLLRGIVLGDEALLASIARAAVPAATLDILVNYTIFCEPIPQEVQDLPEMTAVYVDTVLRPAFARAGITIINQQRLANEAMKAIPTTWSRRLAYGKPAETLLIQARCDGLRIPD